MGCVEEPVTSIMSVKVLGAEKEANQRKTTSGYRAYTEKYWQKEENVYGY